MAGGGRGKAAGTNAVVRSGPAWISGARSNLCAGAAPRHVGIVHPLPRVPETALVRLGHGLRRHLATVRVAPVHVLPVLLSAVLPHQPDADDGRPLSPRPSPHRPAVPVDCSWQPESGDLWVVRRSLS